ncbi:MAG: hypothetical protein LBE08_07685, partial [Bifidobacteriaceae bacterium]|nr:hypothetical protein [Bifidobacteriaceae bacterium]
MFVRLAHCIVRHPLVTVVAWVLLAGTGVALAIFGVTGESLFERVESDAPRDPASESAEADRIVEDGAESASTLTMAVTGVDLADTAQLGALNTALAPLRADLADIPGVAKRPDGYPMVIDPLNPAFCTNPEIDPASPDAAACALTNPAIRTMVADDARGFLMTVDIEKGLDEVAEDDAAAAIADRLQETAADLTSSDFWDSL